MGLFDKFFSKQDGKISQWWKKKWGRFYFPE
jgi:hypothetical protein